MTDPVPLLRKHLVVLMDGRGAHVDVETVLGKLSFEDVSKKPNGAPRTLWEVFEHLRIAQEDIVEFSRDPDHESPEFPKGYWPSDAAPKDEDAWKRSIESFRRELETMKAMVLDPGVDLFAKIPHGDGQTILREATLIADHNAYHLGQMVLMMKMLGLW